MPAKRGKPERVAESKFVNEARGAGFMTRKMNGLGNASWPDQLVIGPGFNVYLEFKRLGEGPTPLQADCHKELRQRGQMVYVVYTVEGAWDAVCGAAKAQGVNLKTTPLSPWYK